MAVGTVWELSEELWELQLLKSHWHHSQFRIIRVHPQLMSDQLHPTKANITFRCVTQIKCVRRSLYRLIYEELPRSEQGVSTRTRMPIAASHSILSFQNTSSRVCSSRDSSLESCLMSFLKSEVMPIWFSVIICMYIDSHKQAITEQENMNTLLVHAVWPT